MISYAIVAALAACAIYYSLGPAVLAGFFAYAVMDAAKRKLFPRAGRGAGQTMSVLVLVFLIVGVASLATYLVRESLSTVPDLLVAALPRLAELAEKYGFDLPFETAEEMRQLALDSLSDNAGKLTHASGLLTKRFFHLLAGVLVAVFAFLAGDKEPSGRDAFDSIRGEFYDRMRLFNASFERVVGAQVVISAINTALTALFLIFAGIPHYEFLIPSTFVLGLLPLVGNILSNTAITSAALAISPQHAAFALVFLVVIHKVEYILNGRIVGASLRMPMWQTMLGILVGEVVLGVPGIVLAPALMHYARTELQALPASR
jgi:predicted PurR-regulated permease PerM